MAATASSMNEISIVDLDKQSVELWAAWEAKNQTKLQAEKTAAFELEEKLAVRLSLIKDKKVEDEKLKAEKKALAESYFGLADKFHILSKTLSSGEDEKICKEKCAKNVQIALDLGSDKAQCTFGEYHRYGFHPMLMMDVHFNANVVDHEKSIEYYKLSATQNNSEAQCSLGACYEKGVGVAQNDVLAFQYYNMAAAQKNHSAENALSCCYEEGRLVGRHLLKAREFKKRAEEPNHPYIASLLIG